MSRISIISTKKFKDVVITLRFANQDQSKKTQRALLALMLSDRSAKYNSKVKMNQKLDNMFGATLTSSVHDYGQAHVLDLSLGVLNEKFVKADLFEDQIQLLQELVYHPLLTKEVFNEAVQVLKDMLLRESDNLSSYTSKQALRLAGEGFPLAYDRIGNLKALETITLEDVQQEMKSLLKNDVLNIIVVGDVNKEKTTSLLNATFTNNNIHDSFKSSYLLTSNEVKNKVEKRETQQAYMTIVYDTNTLNYGKEYWVLQIMSMILGGLPNSFLFQEVREKRSLCYTIRASVRGYDGVMFISSGVRLDSVDQAVDLSLLQVDRIIASEFTDELLESAKSMLVDSIYRTDDSNRRMIDSQYRKIILDEDVDTNEIIEMVNQVSRKEVIKVAKRLKLNTIYKLVGKDLHA
ncbi:MAG: insulinase family protein [Erysipelothrix sp.]|nr:insulinase family protein [Erysipelothrix sp.]